MPRATSALLLGAVVLGGCGGSAPAFGSSDADAASTDVPAEAPAADALGGPGDAADAAHEVAPEAPPPPVPYDRPAYVHFGETGLFDDFAA